MPHEFTETMTSGNHYGNMQHCYNRRRVVVAVPTRYLQPTEFCASHGEW
jgi:hypothetical protein